MSISKAFTACANAVAHATGRPLTFVICVLVVLAWAITGPLFGFSDTWQLIINTGTTIVTFLMVFLIQNTQNRDSAAIQAKLDELIRTSAAQNAFIGIERLTEEELAEIREKCEARAKVAAAADRAEDKANRRAAQAAERAIS
ncbi:low affinity iron permease family protein [Siccirubricoccus sp. KC 17139]|uniref:Low affinity iron permease family protein n=1 Tax=Siccirubricoccus soli TaxID=2899147 RepID=A0ABT1D7R7_9PROT|nr:low affinity iron permease family protein [Siccirubricoccus soli]MCO6417967.1 low affinity iron permease family protein [Siccirubricoccus soli]MCP2684102.1 low affinity iron permease family protein [Siccirubricoccus soli]